MTALQPQERRGLSEPRSAETLRAPGVCRSAGFGLVANPVLETCRAEARVIAWGEALIVHFDAVVECLGISDYRPCVPGCVQEPPHEVILPNRFGTGQIERAVERLSEGDIGHDRGDIIRHNGLHQNWW